MSSRLMAYRNWGENGLSVGMMMDRAVFDKRKFRKKQFKMTEGFFF